jgi:transposase-like protein
MSKFPKEVRERSVRLVLESQSEHTSQWAAVQSVAAKIGCSAQTLNNWVNKALTDRGERAGLRSSDSERIKQLERENRELKRSNEILRQASAFFAQAELDRVLKR